jgi:hypothetical protein
MWFTQLASNQLHAVRFMGGNKNDALDKQLAAIWPIDRKGLNFWDVVQVAEKTFLDDYAWIPLWRQSGDFGIMQPWVKNLFFGPYLSRYGCFWRRPQSLYHEREEVNVCLLLFVSKTFVFETLSLVSTLFLTRRSTPWFKSHAENNISPLVFVVGF